MCARKLFALLLLACCLLPSSAQASQSPKETISATLSGMKIDLQLLQISMTSYEQKISELQSLINQSTIDSSEQAKLLQDSADKLEVTRIQFSALSTQYESLKKHSRFYSRVIKYGGIVSAAIILTEGVIIAIK